MSDEQNDKPAAQPEFLEDRGDNFTVIDYRCSQCGLIGGDSDLGAYDGCPKNDGKKHDMNGGEV